MATVKKTAKNKLSELLAYNPRNKTVCYCQIIDKNQLCNLTTEFECGAYPSKLNSANCIANVAHEHPHVSCSSNPARYLNVEHSPVKRSNTQHVISNVTAILERNQIEHVMKYTSLERIILRPILDRNTFN